MKILNKDKLNSSFNESKINHIEIKLNSIEVLLDCISMESNNKFPEDNRLKFVFNDFGRIAVSYRLGEWDDENAEIVDIEQNALKSKFHGLVLDSMYGWEFINTGNEKFKEWQDKLSLNQINNPKWEKMNTLDLFAEQYGDEITIDVRIWFDNLKIFNFLGKELSIKEFIQNGERGWNQIYNTGIQSENHKTKKLE